MNIQNRIRSTVFLYPLARSIWRMYVRISGQAHIAYLSFGFKREEVVTVTSQGEFFRILVNPRNGYVDKHVRKYGFWDESISSILLSKLTPGDVCVDVGANIGFLSLLAASIVGPTGRVLAIEPLKDIANQIQRSKELNEFSQLEILTVACGEKCEKLVIHASEDTAVSSFLAQNETLKKYQDVIVTVVPLDEIAKNLEKVTLIKIDVEGFELEVLRGARRTIEKHQPILVIEYSPSFYDGVSSDIKFKIVDILEKFGYSVQLIESHSKLSAVIAPQLLLEEPYSRGVWNILCMPKSR